MDEAEREAYRERRAEDQKLEHKVLDVIGEAIEGSEWDIEDGILKDVLVVMTFVDSDGDHMTNWLCTGAWTTAEGMAIRVTRDVHGSDVARHMRMMQGGLPPQQMGDD